MADDDDSLAVRAAERVGYAIGALIYGPKAALEMRARRATRRALLEFCKGLDPMELVMPPRSIGRACKLPRPGRGDPLAVEIRIELHERKARVLASTGALPAWVKATLGRAPGALHGVKLRRVAALAMVDGLLLESDTLDAELAAALLRDVAAGPLARLKSFELEIESERARMLTFAPMVTAEWRWIGEGLVRLSEWMTAKWPESYR